MVSMLRQARRLEGGCDEDSIDGVPDDASRASLSKGARSDCPAMPCPFCVLELDHLASHEAVIARWRRLESEFFDRGGCHQAHLMRAAAVTWIEDAMHSDHDVGTREGWAKVGRFEPSTHAHAVCQRIVRGVPNTAICLDGFFWAGDGPDPAAGGASVWRSSGPGEVRNQCAATSWSGTATGPRWGSNVPVDPDVIQWFYFRSGKKMDKWTLYDDDSQKVLRRAWGKDHNAYLELDGWNYEVDLQAMSQMSLQTGAKRQVCLERHRERPG